MWSLGIRNKVIGWMVQRTEPASTITLVHRNCYIFPNRYGFLFIIVLLVMLVGATNYQNNLAYALTFLLASAGLMSIFLTFRNLVGVTLTAGQADPVFVGDDALFPIYLSSPYREHIALGVGIDQNIQKFVHLSKGRASSIELAIKAKKRGQLKISRIYMATTFPLGMLRCWTWIPLELEGLVYPLPIAPTTYVRSSHIDDSEGAERRRGTDDFESIRDYRAGDSLKHIDWKAFARGRGLYTKEFSETVGESSMIDWLDFDTQDVELKLSYMCYLVLAADRELKQVGIRLPSETIEPAQGRAHTQRCLKALALYGL